MNISKKNIERTKVLHVIAALERGGAERQLQILVNNATSEYKTGILYLTQGSDIPKIREKVDLLQITPTHKENIFGYLNSIHLGIKNWNPDIIHLWLPEIITIPCAIVGKIYDIPMVSAQRRSIKNVSSIYQMLRDRSRYLQHILADQLVTNFNTVNEPTFYQFLFQRKNGKTIPNSIELALESENKDFPNLLEQKDVFKLWFTGRFVKQKCLPLLINAVEQLRKQNYNVVLFVCGQGSEKETSAIKQIIQEKDLVDSIILLGYRKDWHTLVQKADLLVMPSIREGMPNVMLEAMALGVPVLASDIPEIKALVNHQENAYLFSVNQINSLIDSLKYLHDSEKLRKDLGKNGKEYAKQFSSQANMVNAYENLYAQLLQRKKSKK